MLELMIQPDTASGLAEEDILPQPWLSTLTLPDLLARSDIKTAEAESSYLPRRVVIRMLGYELPLESADAPQSLRQSIQAVGDLLRLPQGWNSYSAKPISVQNARTAIELLIRFLEAKTPPPDVVPRVQGAIQLEWHTHKIDIEVYIDSPDKVNFFAEDVECGDSFEGPLWGNEEKLRAWVHRISQE